MLPTEHSSGAGAFKATPDDITRAVGTVNNHMTTYATSVAKLYNKVEELKAAWSGADSEAYTSKITEKRPAIAQIVAVMGEYTQLMTEAAAKMGATQTGIVAQANKL